MGVPSPCIAVGRYFRCPDRCGVLVAPSKVTRLDANQGAGSTDGMTVDIANGKTKVVLPNNYLRRRTSFAVSAIGTGAVSAGGPAVVNSRPVRLVSFFIFSPSFSSFFLPCLILAVSCFVPCRVLSCRILSCLACPVLSCLVLSCLVLSCPVLSCLVLSVEGSRTSSSF